MKIVTVNKSNLEIYLNLCQAYEAEFSSITKKIPNEHGLFELDTFIGEKVFGYLCYVKNSPVGIAAIKCHETHSYEVAEFYVIPSQRGNKLGENFAKHLFDLHSGEWEVKQIAGADNATKFWRSIISKYSSDYKEDSFQDSYWGKVTRQRFSSK